MIPSSTAAEILSSLVAIPTPSSHSNVPLLRWVMAYFEPRGWTLELLPYLDDGGIEKANLIARPAAFSSDRNIDLAFICHTDTVPFAAAWQNALSLIEVNGYLHGCGACDVKGALACWLAAVSETDVFELKNVALILTADEEIGCKGMDRLLASTDLHIRSAIVSEPTSLRAGIAGKGYGLARITIKGQEAHSAFPQQGVSAISIAARLIVDTEDKCNTKAKSSTRNALFDPPQTTFNIGTIEGGTAKNIVAGQATFLVEWRPLPGEDPAAPLAVLDALASEAQARQPLASIQVEAMRADHGFSASPEGRLQRWLSRELATSPIGISFGSEATRVARIAEEVIVIGPGDMRSAHSERECVPITELETWTHTLRQLMTTDHLD